jgi:hypothetical protein
MRESEKTHAQKVKEMFANLLAGPSFANVESLFVESCFRRDSGKYIEMELIRKHSEWVTQVMAPEIKKLLNSKEK